MFHPLPTQKTCTAVDTAELLLSKVFLYHELPRSIISYSDPKLTGQWGLEFCRVLQIYHHFTTAFHPQASGLVERTNQTMETDLRGQSFDCGNWFYVLPYVEMAKKSASLPSSHLSPYYLNYGFHTTTESYVYSHFSTAQDRLEYTYDFFQRIHQD